MSDDTSLEGPLKFSRRVLQGLIVACHAQNETDQSSHSPDEFLYVKNLKSQSISEDSSGTEDSTNAAPHLAPTVPKPYKLQRYTSTESTGSGFQKDYEERVPLSASRSVPETPLEWSYGHMSQLSLQSFRDSMPREFSDTMPEKYGPWETSGDSNAGKSIILVSVNNISLID